MKKLLTIVFLAIGLTGCATSITHMAETVVKVDTINDKNYSIGVDKTVNVGEPMVRHRNYILAHSTLPVMRFSQQTRVDLGGMSTYSFNISPDTQYRVLGTLQYSNPRESYSPKLYYVVQMNPSVFAYILVEQNGSISKLFASLMHPMRQHEVLVHPPTVTTSNPSTVGTLESRANVKMDKGYENYELLYTGVNAQGINLTYREFSPEGLARVAFFQNLTYPKDSTVINFKHYKIQVNRATSEEINFKVITD
jgi:hypothetical protein